MNKYGFWGAVSAWAAFASLYSVAAGADSVEEIVITGNRDLSQSTSIGKLDVPITETPFSISIRDKDFLDAIGAKTVQDSLLHVAGVNGGTYGIDSRGDWSTIRGVSPVLYIDGLQSLYGSYTGARAAAYAYERVEVLKGPSSVLYGQGSTGGVVNLVSKRAGSRLQNEVLVQAGDYDRRVVAADYGSPIDADGHWHFRVVTYERQADAQVDHVSDDSRLIMPSVSWQPRDGTSLTFLYSRQRDKTGTTAAFLPWQGTLLPNPNGDIPTDTFISEPGWDKYNTEQDNYSLWFEHRFNDTWSLNANTRYSDGEVDYQSMWANFTGSLDRFAPDMRTVGRTAYVSDNTSELWIYDVRATADFSLGEVANQVSFGVDYLEAESDRDSWQEASPSDTIDLYSPVYGNIPAGYTLTDNPSNSSQQTGFYVQQQLTWQGFIVNAGLRRDFTESKEQFAETETENATTARLGMMYALDFGLTPYLSYTESFEPVYDTDAYGNSYQPVAGEQWEAGVKYQPAGTGLLVTATAYEILQTNRLTPDPFNPVNQVQTGEVTIDGLELEVNGSWGPVDVVANASTTNTEVTESNNPGELGNAITAIPEKQASLWGFYRFAGPVEGLRVGLGARYVGESATGINGYDNPDYTLYDAAIAYDLARWRFQLNASNLTDEVHTTSCLARGDCFYGERRYITAEARYRF